MTRLSFGTKLLETTIVPTSAGRFDWYRRPGIAAPAGFADIPHAFGLETRDGAAQLVFGQRLGAGSLYSVTAATSVAASLSETGPTLRHSEALAGLGNALASMHAVSAPAWAQPPRAYARLNEWFTGRGADEAVTRARQIVRYFMGESAWSIAFEAFTSITESAKVGLVHGAPSLGSLLDGAGNVELLTGEDLAVGSAEFDIGWVIGELVELKWILGGDPVVWQSLLNAFLEGYGQNNVVDWRRLAAVRIMLHLHDFSAYVGTGVDSLSRYAVFLRELVEDRTH